MTDRELNSQPVLTPVLTDDLLILIRDGQAYPVSILDFIYTDGGGRVAGPLRLGRNDTVNEGGQLEFCRASDNATAFVIDCNQDDLRIFDGGGNVRVQLDDVGRWLIGLSEAQPFMDGLVNVSGRIHARAGDSPYYAWNPTDSGGSIGLVTFMTGSSPVGRGAITYSSSTGLMSYNTTSDYRAKTELGPVAASGTVIDAMQPVMAKMHGATDALPMFVAHELAEVASYAVSGEKDAVDADGQPIMQQVNLASLVPLMVAELQDLRRRVAALEAG